MNSPEAIRAAGAVMCNLNDRSGIGDAIDCCDEEIVDEIKSELAAIIDREMNAWRPIEEAPKDELVILWSPAGGRSAGWFCTVTEQWRTDDGGYMNKAPTHFRELPAPPKP